MTFGDETHVPASSPALVAPDRVWTYGELDRTTATVSDCLRARGAGRGETVAVLAHRDASGIIGVLACARAGAAFLALDPGLPAGRLREMAGDSGARYVLGTHGDLNRLDLPAARIPLPVRPAPPGASAGWARRRDDDPAYLVYTSGTTGRPKAVVTTCLGLRNVARQQREILGITGSSRIMQMAPVSFDAFVFEILMAFGSGAALVLPARRGDVLAKAAVDRMRSERVTHLVTTPTMLAVLPAGTLPDLTVVCSVGEACNSSVVAKWQPGRRLFNLYGPAESTVWATWTELDSASDPACIGQAINGVTAMVLDDDLRSVPPGRPGELYLTGPNIALGYHSRGRLTAERFLPGPDGTRRYATGDVVAHDAQGNLRFVRRADRQIKVQGARVEPGEIEDVIRAMPAVRDAFVTAIRDEVTGSELLAAVYCRAENGPDPRTISRGLADMLPRWMVPQHITVLDQLPLTGNGKTDERAVADLLRESLGDRRATSRPAASGHPAEHAGTMTAAESRLLELASAVLGHHDLAIDDNFIAAGGNSMLGMRLLAAVEEHFGVTLTLSGLLGADTLSDLAQSIPGAIMASSPPAPRSGQPPSSAARYSYRPSPGQLEIIAADTFLGGSAAFLQPWCERIRGPFDPELFASAIRDVVTRHEALRTRYRPAANGGGIEAVVDDSAAVRHVEYDLRGSDVAAAVDVTNRDCRVPLQLDREHPVRLITVRLADDDHLVTIIIHHVACDDVSYKMLLEQAWQRYPHVRRQADAAADPAEDPAGPRYSEFASRQLSFLDSAAAARQRQWWDRQLNGATPLSLAGRPSDPRERNGRRIDFQLPAEQVIEMELACRALRLTPYAMLSAAFTLALEPYLIGPGCMIGTPCDIRDKDSRETVGFHINMLPIRLQVPAHGTVGAWLDQWQAECLDAFANNGIPYGEIAARMRDGASRPGQLAVIFAVSYTDIGQDRPGPVRRERIQLDPGAVKNELIVTLTKGGGGWTGAVIYDSDVLPEAAASRLLEFFITSLKVICSAPGRAVSELFPTHTRTTIEASDLDFDLSLPLGVSAA
jgi:amino acid adenylation domain-containing protein